MLVINQWEKQHHQQVHDPYATHGAGIFTYMTGSYMGQMLVNILAPWSIWVMMMFHSFDPLST